jgi:hypothetical protein
MREDIKRLLYVTGGAVFLTLFSLIVAWFAPSGTGFEFIWGFISVASMLGAGVALTFAGIEWVKDGRPEELNTRRRY